MGKVVLMEKWPVLGRHERAVVWLRVWADLGRAPRTMDAYARGLAEYLEMCERVEVDPLQADRAHIASYVRELTSGRIADANVVSIDSGAGLANDRWFCSGYGFVATDGRPPQPKPTPRSNRQRPIASTQRAQYRVPADHEHDEDAGA